MIKRPIILPGALRVALSLPVFFIASPALAADCGFTPAGDYVCRRDEPLPEEVTSGIEDAEILPIAGGGPLNLGEEPGGGALTAEEIERAGHILGEALDAIRAVPGEVKVAEEDDEDINVPRGQWYGGKVAALVPYISIHEVLAYADAHGGVADIRIRDRHQIYGTFGA